MKDELGARRMIDKGTATRFTPVQVGERAFGEVQGCIDWVNRGVKLGWPSIDEVIKPMRPGNLCIVQAYTSNYKTGFMLNWARRIAEDIKTRGGRDEIVVYASWEETVEELGIYDLAYATGIDAGRMIDGSTTEAEMDRLRAAAGVRGTLPLWVMGNSLSERRKQNRMTLTDVAANLEWIEGNMDPPRKPLAIFLDYLNLIQPEGRVWGDNRRTDIMELSFRARELAFRMGCPVIMGAQSNRLSNDRAWKLPQKPDVMESSAIEQYCQLMLSLWRPILTEPEGDLLRGPDGEQMDDLPVTQNLLIMGLNKQKRGRAGGWWPLYIDPARNVVGPMKQGGGQ